MPLVAVRLARFEPRETPDMVEFWRAEFGRLKEELAAVTRTPLLFVYTN